LLRTLMIADSSYPNLAFGQRTFRVSTPFCYGTVA